MGLDTDACIDKYPAKALLWKLLMVYFPTLGGSLINYIGTILNNVAVVRHASTSEYAGLIHAASIAQCLCLSIGIGLSGGLDTLASQAFGAKEYRLAGQWLNRCRLLIACVWLPLSIILLNVRAILTFIGISEETADVSQKMTYFFGVGYFMEFQYEAIRRFGNTVGRASWGLVAACVSLPVHAAVLFGCLHYSSLGIYSCGVAVVCAQAVQLAIVQGFVWYERSKFPMCKLSRHGPTTVIESGTGTGIAPTDALKSPPSCSGVEDRSCSLSTALLLPPSSETPLTAEEADNALLSTPKIALLPETPATSAPLDAYTEARDARLPSEHQLCLPDGVSEADFAVSQCCIPFETADALTHWGPFLAVGVPAASMVCAEWWCFEILVLQSGRLGDAQAAASGIFYMLVMLHYMNPMSMATALGAAVGQRIGAGDVQGARRYVPIGFGFTLACSGCVIAFFAACQSFAVGMLMDPKEKPEVYSLLVEVWFVVLCYMAFDVVGGTFIGVVRGLGQQRVAAIGNIVGLYGVAQPLVVILMHRWGIYGIWFAAVVGIVIQAATMVVTSYGITDWNKAAEEAQERIGDERDPVEEKHVPSVESQPLTVE